MMFTPQSTNRMCPVTFAAKSEHRNTATLPTSSCGLGHPHDVVARGDLFAAVIRQGEHSTAFWHQGLEGPGQGNKGVDADVHGRVESLPGGLVEGVHQVVPFRIGDGMHQDIHPAEVLLGLLGDGLNLVILGDVARLDEVQVQGFRQGTPKMRAVLPSSRPMGHLL